MNFAPRKKEIASIADRLDHGNEKAMLPGQLEAHPYPKTLRTFEV